MAEIHKSLIEFKIIRYVRSTVLHIENIFWNFGNSDNGKNEIVQKEIYNFFIHYYNEKNYFHLDGSILIYVKN